jgi:enediyne biosynthesis protein E4
MKLFATTLLALLLNAITTQAQDVLIQRDNGTSMGAYFNAAAFTNESVIIPVAGPCQVLEIRIYYLGQSASRDTLIVAGDASEGAVPPTHWVWGYNTIIDPIIVDYNGTPGWKTIDVRDRNLRSDGYDRIVIQHWLKKAGPFFSVDSDAQTTPYWSFLMNPTETNSLGGPGRYYLSTNDYMVRILVRYDYPDGQGSQPPPAPTLTNVAIPAGLVSNSQPVKSAIASVTDWDADGYDDISIGGNYFRNKGDGTFENVTSALGIGGGYAMWGDFDNDGLPDAYVLNGGDNDKLFRNTGTGRFVDVTAASGLSNPAPTVTAVWLDYNGDGHLDLFLANGRRESGGTETYFQDRLWKNNGDGTFTNVTAESGIAAAEPAPYMDTWGATACDYNNDGLTDIFVATYRLSPDMLFRNNGDGTFTEVGAQTGARGVPTSSPQYFGHGMGCDFGDFDNDGWSDLAVGNLGHPDWRGAVSNPSLIFHNNNGVNFTNMQRDMGLKFFEMNSGIAWADLDNDGYLDLWQSQYSYQVAGVNGEPSRFSRVYMNQGPPDFRLRDRTWHTGAVIHGAWTVSRLDYDNDGDIDLLVASPHDGVALFRNDLPRNGGYITVTLQGNPAEGVTQSAFGTRVVAHAGGKSMTRTLSTSSAGSRAATHSTRLHFGLGAASIVDSLVLHYPNGHTRTVPSLAVNRRYIIPYSGEISVGVQSIQTAAEWNIGHASLSSGLLDFTLHAVSPLPSSDVELYDLLGRRLFALRTAALDAGRHSFHLPVRPAGGTYMLVVRNAQGIRSSKLHVLR